MVCVRWMRVTAELIFETSCSISAALSGFPFSCYNEHIVLDDVGVYLGIHCGTKCLEMAFVQLAEAVEITGDCVLCMSFLQLLEYNAALLHKLHVVRVSGAMCVRVSGVKP